MRRLQKTLVAVFVFLAALCLCAAVCAEPEETFTAEISQLNSGEDNQSFGVIEQAVIPVEEGQTIRIDMSEVFAMYPEHSGIYGMLYTTGEAKLTAAVPGNEMEAAGTGVVEFSFPGAEDCTLQGKGTIYAYFLPVMYQRISTSVSLVTQAFDTSYLTKTAVGHSNMFMIADAHTSIWQNSIPPGGTVYKFASSLGPIPSQYSQFGPHMDFSPSLYHFLYNTPILFQCDALEESAYRTDTYTARPMVRHSGTDEYEIWVYKDIEKKGGMLDQTSTVFTECLKLAHEQFLAQGLKVDKVLTIVLGEELGNAGLHGVAISDEMVDRIGFINSMYINSVVLKDEFSNLDYYTFAHEIGHVIQDASLAYNHTAFAGWFSEGFATYFGEKACRRMGRPYEDTETLNETDSAEINKFHSNLVFGIDDYETYYDNGTWSESIIVEPFDNYTFGSLFFRYLESRYGEGFYKRISWTFYEKVYKGQEYRFFARRNDFNYRVDTFFALIRSALSPDVYTAYPAYAAGEMADRVKADRIDLNHARPAVTGNPGDVNEDGAVDGLDVVRLMKYLAEDIDPETNLIYAIHEGNSDVTGDGIVDAQDLLRLVRYLGGEDVPLEYSTDSPQLVLTGGE